MTNSRVGPCVDAHHHIWRVERGDYHWLRPTWPIYRDYDLDDLRPLLSDIGATVLVQAAGTEAETRFLLDSARASSGLVQAVVGWTDLAASGAADRVFQLSGEALLRGLRPMLQDIAEGGWILSARVASGTRRNEPRRVVPGSSHCAAPSSARPGTRAAAP